VRGEGAPLSAGADLHSWELRLVQEYCDIGSLRDALASGMFKARAAGSDSGAAGGSGAPDFGKVVATAIDVARAMAHLHARSILHSDLKARNVLLKSSPSDPKQFTAKVADFGLSLEIDPSETHVSNAFQGTVTHMAPELLLAGRVSKASDVYAVRFLVCCVCVVCFVCVVDKYIIYFIIYTIRNSTTDSSMQTKSN
jgi:serine/threonine protein kinase